MAQTIKLKRSNTSGTKPTTSSLALGEIALNTKDGLFFLRRHVDGTDGNDTIRAYTPEYLTEYDSQIDVTVTVDTKTAAHPQYGNGSSDGFLLDGLEGPFLVLVPGNTYRFDQSDSSNTGHPLRFYYESDKTTSFTTGVTTNGTAGSSGAYTEIAVTTSTPTVLYYQCSSHSLMGSGSYCGGGTIVEDQLAANSVTSAKIAANAVTSSEIAANAITSSEIAANSVDSAEIASNAITSAHISSGVVIEADVADNAITSAKIAANAIGSSEIAANSVGTSEIAANSVGTSEIASNAITSALIAANQVGISELNVSDGTSGQALTTNGSGTLSFSDVSSTLSGATDSNISSPSSGQVLVYDGTNSWDNVSISGDATLSNTGALTIAANAIEASMIAANAVGASEIAGNSVGIDELNVTDGTSGQVLTTDGAGTLSFSTVSGGGSQNLFSTIAVSGQSDIVADSTTDTLTIAAGSGITLGTNASTDTLTITATGGGLSANAVTSAYLASNAVLARHIAANAVGASEIASSGATAGTYGSATATPQITVDADGRISNVSNVTITGSGGSAYGFTNQVDQDSFTGDGSTTSFDTGATITDENLTWVFIDGVYQQKNSYSVSGSSVVFSAAPPNGTTIEVMHLRATTTGSGLNTNSFNGDGSTTDFTLATTPQSEDDIIAFIGGVFQNQDSYTFSGTTLSFDTAPANGTKIVVYVISGVITGKANLINNFSGDNSTTDFTLSINPQHENNINVFIDGVYQQKSEFSVSGTTLTFSSAPPSGTDNIEVEINQITTTTSLAANTVTAATIAANAVGSAEIAANAVGSSEIAANAIGTSELSSGALNGQTFTGDSEITGEFTADEFIGDLRGAVTFKAQAGENVSKGDVVYISGISGNTTVVSLADADDAAKMPAFGVVAATTTSGQPVDIYTSGILSSIDTSSYSEGDELFVSTTAGALTDTAPTGETSKLQKIAKVTRSDASAGSIFITGAGRTNAVPNLDDGDIFLGNGSNQAVTASLNTKIEDYLDAGTSTPTFASFTMSNSTATAYDGTADQEGATVRIINTNNTTSDTFADIRFESHSSSTGRARIGMELPSVNNSELFFVTENSGSLAEAMRIDSSGNVGIGTGSPNSRLHVVHPVSEYTTSLSETTTKSTLQLKTHAGDSTITTFGGVSGGDAYIQRSNGAGTTSYGLLLNPYGGNVGIGTTSPDSTFEVATNDASGNRMGIVGDGATTGSALWTNWTTGNSYLDFRLGGTTSTYTKMRIDSSGNVGIGTTSPSSMLHLSDGVTGVSGGEAAAITLTNKFDSPDNSWTIKPQRTGVSNTGLEIRDVTDSRSDMSFDGAGNVGIGRSSPTATLDVNGSMKVDNIQLQDSSALGIGVVGATSSVGHTASTNEGIFWHTSLADYGVFRTSGSWTGPDYQQLKLSWDTGIVLDGGANYGQSGISFRGNNTQRMLVSPAGNVMVGTGSPTSKLHVDAGTFAGYAVDLVQGGSGGGNHGLRVVSGSGSSYTAIFRANASTVFYVDGAGNYYFSGSNQSDLNKKENIADITDSALDLIAQLQPKTYNFIGSDIDKAGFIAQDMEQVIPRLVSGNEFDPDATDEDGNNPTGKGIDYMGYTAYLTKAIQEQQTIIDDLKARIETLENN